mmetsp:Transcript_70122/g.222307  ORF Transcript_70122/g.222307 Transcript_70122/m.222307 type:complete len:461 (+) Transcript_70122:36-1418(+)
MHFVLVHALLQPLHRAHADRPVCVQQPQQVVFELRRVGLEWLHLVKVVVTDLYARSGRVEAVQVDVFADLEHEKDPHEARGRALGPLPLDPQRLHPLHGRLVHGDGRDEKLRGQEDDVVVGELLPKHGVVMVRLGAPQQPRGPVPPFLLLLAIEVQRCLLQECVPLLAVQELESRLGARVAFESLGRRVVVPQHGIVLVDDAAGLGPEQPPGVAHNRTPPVIVVEVAVERVVLGETFGEARAAELPLRLEVRSPLADVPPRILVRVLLPLVDCQRREVPDPHCQPLHQIVRMGCHLVLRAVAPSPARVAPAHLGAGALPVDAPGDVAQRAVAVPAEPPWAAGAQLLPEDEVAVLALPLAVEAIPPVVALAVVRLHALAVRTWLCAHRFIAAAAFVAVLARAVPRAEALAVVAPLRADGFLAEVPCIAPVAVARAVVKADPVAILHERRLRLLILPRDAPT